MEELAGQVVFMTGSDTSLGAGLAEALTAAGATVGAIIDLSAAASVEAAFTSLTDALGSPSAVVHNAVDPVALDPRPIEEVDDERFHAIWEKGMSATIWCCQAALRAFRSGDGGGRIVLVTPTLSMSGASGLAPWCALVEGQRLLAKSAARQWGRYGVNVNCLAPAPELVLAPGSYNSEGISLAPAAMGGPGDPRADVGPVLVALIGAGMRFVTGATICADGGVWMSP
jgi:NAD(P)-dependent dehydrogenase (short-subunit alcohol dehydrogenase family)